ncbi:EF-hand calcium-binding domain-containing protein 12-like [Dendronephthya gigantea]|uniref:EF-hand calcium-binding domain-containing protein 12-like n=1 Tax=Dendronephthya gigantea TaxID=151771 RepID=UPI00106C1B8C|nr:EF-hand calcium-binding domain-containing protein 12-like [Dendronephthya gigantea]
MELRIKNLGRTKAYRDALSRSKDIQSNGTTVPRKRVIIAPKMACVPERCSDFSAFPPITQNKTSKKKDQITDCYFDQKKATISEFNNYKAWVKERKRLRRDLDQCEMVSDWLQSKPNLTEVEQRVQDSLTKISDKIPASRIKNRETSNGGQVFFNNYDSRFAPVINQPLPVAFATINEYLAKKRLRFYDLFVQADRDKDWHVNRDELKDVMKQHRIPLKDAEIDQFIQALDENNDDVLEYKELVHGRDLFILSERIKKHLGEEDAVIEPSDNLGIIQGDTLNCTNQIAVQFSSQSLLSLPGVSSSDHIFTTSDQDGEKRLKRQKKREKHRQKTRSPEKAERESSTMGGVTGVLVDAFQRQKENEYEKILELCHLHGIPLSKNLLERVLLHPEDRDLDTCISSLKPSDRYLMSEKDLYRRLEPSNAPGHAERGGRKFSKSKRKINFYSCHVYPPAASVTPKSERMNLSSGPANISRKADCWMTYEEYCNLTRHLDSRFDKSWKPTEEDSYWPSYVLDKVRLYLERPRTQVRSENSIFDVIHNRTIH